MQTQDREVLHVHFNSPRSGHELEGACPAVVVDPSIISPFIDFSAVFSLATASFTLSLSSTEKMGPLKRALHINIATTVVAER